MFLYPVFSATKENTLLVVLGDDKLPYNTSAVKHPRVSVLSSQTVKSPVGLHGAKRGVVRVKRVVGRASQLDRNRATFERDLLAMPHATQRAAAQGLGIHLMPN